MQTRTLCAIQSSTTHFAHPGRRPLFHPSQATSMSTPTPQPVLPRRPLGQTGLELSVLGFGAGVLGNIYEDVSVNQETATSAVHAAFAAGVNYFDTSPYYGATKSEQVLGEALKGLSRSELVISTKVGRYGADTFDFSAARVTASVHESLKRLQLEYVDILICHDVEFGDPYQVINEALPALVALKAQGLVKAIGFSCLPLETVTFILDRVAPGTVDCILSYCHYSLNDSTLRDLLPYLETKGVAVIGASPFAMGLLTAQGPSSWHPAPPELQLACKQAAALAESEGVAITRLALAYSVKEPRISSMLVGMGTAQQVADNCACVLQALGLQPNPRADLEETVTQQVMQLLEPVQGLTWQSGKPLPQEE